MTSLVCDWGTSSFRLMRLDEAGEIVSEKTSNRGIKNLSPGEIAPYLADACEALAPGQDLPVILCGMVGSSIGWSEVPYVDCPADLAALASGLTRMPDCGRAAVCVPGVQIRRNDGTADVMRGEEAQVMGWLQRASDEERQESLLCLPGTHSKWVHVVDGEIREFGTAFTGELYALLRDHSVLVQGEQAEDEAAFAAGLEASAGDQSLIFQLFAARSRAVLGLQAPAHSAAFLSGLLLGSEVVAMREIAAQSGKVHLICNPLLADRYQRALGYFGLEGACHPGDGLSAAGMFAIADTAGLLR